MSLPSNNKDLYSGIEFSTWLNLQTLWPEEEYLIKKYLNPQLSVVEAGVNGGRILLKMQEMGFTSLAGFDYVPELIDRAIDRDPERKIDFQVQNAIDLAHAMGNMNPRVAILSATESVNPKIQSTLDAAALCKMADRGQITGGLLDGPLGLDNAVDLNAARIKKIASPVAG